MGDLKDKMPTWAKRTLLVAAMVGPLAAAVATSVKTYYEVKSAKKSAVEADKNSEASYETLAPAVAELQAVSEEEQAWANDMSDYTQELENRIIRLEAYIEVISRQGNMPRPMPVEAMAAARNPASKPEPDDMTEQRKVSRPVPQSLDKAKAYQQQRTKENCSPDDPLCGMADL